MLDGGPNPTGTITFNLYGPDDATCAGDPVFTSGAAVNGSGACSSGTFTPSAPGIYCWTAVYSGDGTTDPASSPCDAPSETVEIRPFVPPPPTRTIAGNFRGPVTVNAGQNVRITNARVSGPVTVTAGGALTIDRSAVTNGVVVTAPAFVSVCGSQVSGPSSIPGRAWW